MRRKLLILARESGLSMEATDILIEGILPQACLDAPSVDEFFIELERNDQHFNQLLEEADKEEGVLTIYC